MKTLRILFYSICIAVMMSTVSFAYLDPSVMTYTIQVVAGVVIAIGAVAGVMWRKATRKAKEKLGIDENAKKEVEEEVVKISDKEE